MNVYRRTCKKCERAGCGDNVLKFIRFFRKHSYNKVLDMFQCSERNIVTGSQNASSFLLAQ